MNITNLDLFNYYDVEAFSTLGCFIDFCEENDLSFITTISNPEEEYFEEAVLLLRSKYDPEVVMCLIDNSLHEETLTDGSTRIEYDYLKIRYNDPIIL